MESGALRDHCGRVQDAVHAYFQRPARGVARRLRGAAYGTNIEIAPGRVRLLLEFSRHIGGKTQSRADSFIAQLQVQF